MLRIYNTLSRKKETLKPRRGKKINIFVCGPTVYDLSHIGHARTYAAFDTLVKYLRQKEYDVFYLQNITDIDDKIINRAKEKGITPKKLARNFEKEYLKDMKSLSINSVSKYARATDYIQEIISQVKRLLKKGYAYQIKDGIYYDISKFKDYGKLSGRTVQQAEDATSRIDEAKEKRNKGDFCLWKFSPSTSSGQAKEKEPKWPSPWGEGRPGWHIEDTAITEKFFGPQYDIHGGARDLIIPHHEAEISQMEAISGKKPLAKYWAHTEFLTVKAEKMSKSSGNFTTIKDFVGAHSPRILRFFVLKSHYRSPIDYTESAILQVKRELEKIDEFVGKLATPDRVEPCVPLRFHPKETSGVKSVSEIKRLETNFESAMEDDFNTPKAMAAIFELINHGNALMAKGLLIKTDAKNILNFLKEIDKFFNVIFWPKPAEIQPRALLDLVKQRGGYRKEKERQKTDEIRQKIKELGWLIEDTENGPKLSRLR